MKTVAINQGGRRPKAGVRRYPGGQILHADRAPLESEEDVKATVLEARMRRELGIDAWLAARGSPRAMREARQRMDDQFRGYELGKLYLRGKRDAAAGVTKDQHDAGGYFLFLYGIECRRNGTPSPNTAAISYGEARGLSTAPADSEAWIADMRARWLKVYAAIFETQRDCGPIYEALKRVLVEDLPPRNLEEVGALRMGLNAVNRARGV